MTSFAAAETYDVFLARLTDLPNGTNPLRFAAGTITADTTIPVLPPSMAWMLYPLAAQFLIVFMLASISVVVIIHYRGLWLFRIRQRILLSNPPVVTGAMGILAALLSLIATVDQIVLQHKLFGVDSSRHTLLVNQLRWLAVFTTNFFYAHSITAHITLFRRETQHRQGKGSEVWLRMLNGSIIVFPLFYLAIQIPLLVLTDRDLTAAMISAQATSRHLLSIAAAENREELADLDPFLGTIEHIYSLLRSATTLHYVYLAAWAVLSVGLIGVFLPYFIYHLRLLVRLRRSRKTSTSIILRSVPETGCAQRMPEAHATQARRLGRWQSLKASRMFLPATAFCQPLARTPKRSEISGIHSDTRILLSLVSIGFLFGMIVTGLAIWSATTPLLDNGAWWSCQSYDLVLVAVYQTLCGSLLVTWPAWRLLTNRDTSEEEPVMVSCPSLPAHRQPKVVTVSMEMLQQVEEAEVPRPAKVHRPLEYQRAAQSFHQSIQSERGITHMCLDRPSLDATKHRVADDVSHSGAAD